MTEPDKTPEPPTLAHKVALAVLLAPFVAVILVALYAGAYEVIDWMLGL